MFGGEDHLPELTEVMLTLAARRPKSPNTQIIQF